MKQYFKEIVLLLGDDSRKIPWMILLFLCSSFLDLAGLGLIGPYVALAITPSSITEWHLYNFLEFYGIPHDQNIILTWLGLILVGVFMLKSILVIYINKTIIKFSSSQEVRIKSFLMQAYQQMPYIVYLERNSAEYIQAIQSYTTSFGTVLQTILKTVSDGLVAIAILAIVHEFAHGVVALENDTIVINFNSTDYNPKKQFGININSLNLKIPKIKLLLSKKDKKLMELKDFINKRK